MSGRRDPGGTVGGSDAQRRPRCLMVGLGGPTFITDWATAVSRFADVVGVRAVKSFPVGAIPIDSHAARGEVGGHAVIFVRVARVHPKRLFWRLNGRVEAALMKRAVSRLGPVDGRVDIIHSHGYAAAAALPSLSELLGVPFIHTEHSSNLAASEPLRYVTRPGLALMRRVFGEAETVMLVGEGQLQAVHRLAVPGRFLVVPNPIDTVLFDRERRPRMSPHRLVSVGHLLPRKRLDLLLRAVSLVRSGLASVRLDIVGDGSERAALEDLTRRLGLDGSVRFHGSLPRPQVAAVLAESDMYVHTSERESFGVSIVEAMLAGLPVVAVRCGGVTEELPPDLATVIEQADPHALAEAIRVRLAVRPVDDGAVIGSWARKRYGVDSVAGQIESVYRQALRS